MAIKKSAYNDETAKLAAKRYKLSSDYVKPYFDNFIDNYKHYFQRVIQESVEQDPNAYPFYSQMTIPIGYQVVETLLPRTVSKEPTFSIKTEEENDEMAELKLASLIKYQMAHPYLIDDPIFLRLSTAAKEMFITGNAWGMVPWTQEEAEIEEYQPYSTVLGLNEPSWENMERIREYGIKPQWKVVTVKKKVIDAPVFRHISIFHVFPDPAKKRVSDLGYAIVEEWMTYDEIKSMVKISEDSYKNMEVFEAMKVAKKFGTVGMIDYDQQIAEMFGSDNYATKGEGMDGQFKVWFMLEKNKYSIIINGELTIRDGKNPNGDGKLGLILMKDIPIPNELYAWGEIDPIKKIEDGMTDQANMRADSVFYDLMRIWKLDPTSLIDGEEFSPEPGSIIQMTDLNGLQPVDTGSTKASAYREHDEWNSIIQSVTGVNDYSTGGIDGSMNKTFGGVELLQQAANARFGFKLQLFEQLGLKAIGTMYVQRNLRFFDSPQALNTEQGKLVVTPDDIRIIRGNIHFMVDAGSTQIGNKNADVNKWKFISDQVGANKAPFNDLSQAAQDEIGKRLLYALDEKDVEKLLERKQELPLPAGVNPNGANPLVPNDLVEINNDQQSAPDVQQDNAQAVIGE